MANTKKSPSDIVDVQAERALLCSILLDPKCIVKAPVCFEDFGKREHQQIWGAILRLTEAGTTVDTIEVTRELRRVRMLELVGDGSEARGEDYVDGLLMETPTAGLVEEYAARVRERGIMRRFAEAGEGLHRMASNGTAPDEVLAFARNLVAAAEATPWQCDCEAMCVSADKIKMIPISWLWQDQIALGKIGVIAGDGGLGKSCVTLDLAARVTTGRPFPCDDSSWGRNAGDVVLLSAEDDAEDTIVPRFTVAEGNPAKLHLVTGIKTKRSSRFLNLTTDLEAVESVIRRIQTTKLVIIDPITAYIGSSIKDGNNTEVRSALAPIKELAGRHKVAVLLVTHFRKGTGRAVEKVIGSVAFTAASRSCLIVTQDREDADRRLVLNAKTNIGRNGGGFAYHLEIVNSPVGPHPKVIWEDTNITMTADDAIQALEGAPRRGRRPVERTSAEDYLLKTLAPGPVPGTSILEDRPEGISERTIKRAKETLGISSKRINNQWLWVLPGGGPLMNPNPQEPTEDPPF